MDVNIFRSLSYGLFVIGSKKGERINGQLSNTVFQVTSEPPQVAISINKLNLSHEFIKDSKVFSVSILPKNIPLPLVGRFGFKSGRELEKFAGVPYKTGSNGTPVLTEDTLGYFEAEVVGSYDVGTHTIFIGLVTEAVVYSTEEPITYAYYHKVKGGAEPSTAPTYIKPQASVSEAKTTTIEKEKVTMKKYVCTACGYVYDPAEGDPDGGIAPGTAFEDIPDDWVCPVCGVGKDMFEEE